MSEIRWVLVPLSTLLFGGAAVAALRPPWPRGARLGAACVLGPPLTSLMLFLLCCATGSLQPWMAWAPGAVGAVGLALALRSAPSAEPQGLTRWIVPALAAITLLFLLTLTLLSLPAPTGDGLANFATKARALHGEGSPWPFLRDARTFALHPDYPLHVPFLMCFGYHVTGATTGLAGLAGGLLVLPGMLLFLGSLAGRRGVFGGIVVGALGVALPGVRDYALSGYADPDFAAVLAVAAAGVARGGRRPATAALAAGLLPWIKLEGAALLGILLLVAIAGRAFSWRGLLAWILVAGASGAAWPVALLTQGLRRPIAEDVAGLPLGERVLETLRAFGERLVEPGAPFHLMLLAGAIAAASALRRPRTVSGRAGMVLVAGLFAYPVLAVLRNASRVTLQGDVGQRLLQHLLPIALLVLALELQGGSPED